MEAIVGNRVRILIFGMILGLGVGRSQSQNPNVFMGQTGSSVIHPSSKFSSSMLQNHKCCISGVFIIRALTPVARKQHWSWHPVCCWCTACVLCQSNYLFGRCEVL